MRDFIGEISPLKASFKPESIPSECIIKIDSDMPKYSYYRMRH